MSHDIVLKVYDITRGMAATLGSQLLGRRIEGVWHTGVTVYGMEYFFGGGIQQALPNVFERENNIQSSKEIPLGSTAKTKHEFQVFLDSISSRFTEETYDLLRWNCNHFSNECTKFLINKEIPSEYLNQHEVFLSSPLGAAVIQMIEGMAIRNPVSGRSNISTNNTVPVNSQEPRTLDELQSTEFGRTLQKFINSQSKDKVQQGLDVLEKLTGNIITHCTVPKYRMIKKNNPKLQDTLLNVESGKECLTALGFEDTMVTVDGSPEEPGFYFKTVNATTLKTLHSGRKLIQMVLRNSFNVRPESFAQSELPRPAPSNPFGGDINPIQFMSQFLGAVQQTSPQSSPVGYSSDYSVQLTELNRMGFSNREACLTALRESNGNLNRALDKLLQLTERD